MSVITKNKNQPVNSDVSGDNIAGLFTKGMTHDVTTGLGQLSDVKELQIALLSALQEDCDSVPLVGSRKLVNFQAALSQEQLNNVRSFTMPAAPAVDSAEAASEMCEVYEMALLRDTLFSDFPANGSDIQRAVATLNAFGTDFKGPKSGGLVTPGLLFRSDLGNTLVGPWVSQFLFQDVPLGSHVIEQKYIQRTGQYGITEANWRSIQDGNIPVAQTTGSTRYLATPRDLGSVVHADFVYQQFYYAAAILLGSGVSTSSARFPALATEDGFVTYGGPVEVATCLAEVARHALKTAWIQKWIYHLRTRPEAMAGVVVKEDAGTLSGAVHADLLTKGSNTIAAVKAENVSNGGANAAWLPLLFAEGSPTHPSYPAGHAVLAGACTTMLKILFDDGLWSTTGLTPKHCTDPTGQALATYAEGDASSMTIHGELSKLAVSIATGRNMAGVHYRTDGDKGILLGEMVARSYWTAIRGLVNEEIPQSDFTTFEGVVIQV
jgi:hypothetical protein